MKKILLIIFIGVQTLYAQQTFYKQYGQGQMQSAIGSSCVQQSIDGGYIMTGFIYPPSSDSQVYLVKTDANGDTLWTKIIGGAVGFYGGTHVEQTTDSGYIISGTYQASSIYIIKTNSMGDTLWTKHYNNNGASIDARIKQTSDGGYVVVSTSQAMSGDVWVLKTNQNGDTLWTKTYGGNNAEYGYSIQETTDGGYIIAGQTWSSTAGSSDAYLIKTNITGDTLWTKKYGNTNGETANEVRQTSDGGYVFCGSSTGQIYVVKTDANGNALWQKYFGGISADEGQSIKQTNDGGYVITGKIEHFSSALGVYVADAFLLKINSSGIQQWNRNFGPLLGNPSPSYGNYVSLTSDGGFVMTGENQLDYLIKTDSLGNFLTTGIVSQISTNNKFSTFIYPNPFSSITTIRTNNLFENATLTIYNSLGYQVKQIINIVGQSVELQRDNLPSGLYFIYLTQGDNINSECKLMIIDN
jgi:hypothetical protein